MSVQTVSRIAVLLAADAKLLSTYLKNADGTDDNEEGRETLAHYYRHQLDEKAGEPELIRSGDINAIFQYIQAHLPKPVNGEEPDG